MWHRGERPSGSIDEPFLWGDEKTPQPTSLLRSASSGSRRSVLSVGQEMARCCDGFCSADGKQSGRLSWLHGERSAKSVRAKAVVPKGSRHEHLLELRVRLVTGRTVLLHVAPNETVVAIKLRLQRLEGLEATGQRLFGRGESEIRDRDKARDLVTNGSAPMLTLMMLPSGQHRQIDEALLQNAEIAIAQTDASFSAPLLDFPESPSKDSTPGQGSSRVSTPLGYPRDDPFGFQKASQSAPVGDWYRTATPATTPGRLTSADRFASLDSLDSCPEEPHAASMSQPGTSRRSISGRMRLPWFAGWNKQRV